MKWEIEYRTLSGEGYSLGGVDADSFEDAARIAEEYKGEGEIVIDISRTN